MDTWAKIIIGDSRDMGEVDSGAVDLVVTSPPYWHIKDYGVPGQIGYGQSLHDYLKDLYRVWQECFRVLRPGGRLAVNVGDQFARAQVYGRYKVIPLHAELIVQGEQLGFDFMGSIIWQKKTTMNTSGGAVIMGSYPYPPNGLVEIDYEFILIFKKPGPGKKVSKEIKEASKLTKEEWKEYFAGHWHFGGARQLGHEAMFPEELPRRLIKMFTFVGDTVLDPFLGSGTTVKAALELGRNAIGYEINCTFEKNIREKVGLNGVKYLFAQQIEIRPQKSLSRNYPDRLYSPQIQNLNLLDTPEKPPDKNKGYFKVVGIQDANTIRLDNGLSVRFLGIRAVRQEEIKDYLYKYILGKRVLVKEARETGDDHIIMGYVYLKNRIFVNAYLIKSGLASPEPQDEHRLAQKFACLAAKAARVILPKTGT